MEEDWRTWRSWTLAHRRGERGRPPLALPGTSPHQGIPAFAMDLTGSGEDLEETARRAPEGVYRPLRSEPWHYQVRDGYY